MSITIYGIKNNVNNKVYVGSSTNFSRREKEHKSNLMSNKHINEYLQADWNLYGDYSFEFFRIESVESENAIIREQFWINFYKSSNMDYGYNICKIAVRPNHSEQARKKMSEASKARWEDPEYRANMSEKLKGKIPSQETLEKRSKALTGKKRTPEQVERLRASLLISNGHTEETKQEVLKLYYEGYPTKIIGQKTNTSPTFVYELLEARNLPKRQTNFTFNGAKKIILKTPEVVQKEVIKLHNEGKNAGEICELLELSHGTVRRIKMKFGIVVDGKNNKESVIF